MSVLRLHKRRDASSILYYAPRRAHGADDGRSIRPVLERLRRGDGDDPADGTPIVQDAPALDLGAAPAVTLQSTDPFAIIGRLAVAAGVAGGLGLLAVSLYQPSAGDPAPAQTVAAPQPEPSALPRKVHTLTFQADHATTVQPAAGSASAAADASAAPAAMASEQAQTDDAGTDPDDERQSTLTAPLKAWALVPAQVPTQAAPQAAAESAPPVAQTPPAAEFKQPPAEHQASSAAPPAPPKAASSTHHARHVHHRRRHRMHATHRLPAAAREANAEAQSSESGETALQALFGHPETRTEPNPAK